MTPLSAAFVDAFLSEQEKYEIAGTFRDLKPPYGPFFVAERTGDTWLIHARDLPSRADCERFIVERCAQAGARALITIYESGGPVSGSDVVFLRRLAGDAP